MLLDVPDLGKKGDVNPDVVAKEMRRAKKVSGEQLFSRYEFLTVQQIAFYFSRLAAKMHAQQ